MNRLKEDSGQTTVGTVIGVIAAIIVVIGLGVGLWHFGWFVEEKNVDKQVQIDNRNTGTQTAWRDEVKKTIADYELIEPSNTAARGALRNKACDIIPRLVDPYKDDIIVAFETKECK